MRFRRSFILVALSSILTSVAVAQDTSAIDLKAELNSILEGKGKVTKSRTAYSLVPGRCTGGTSERGHEHVWCEKSVNVPYEERYLDSLHVINVDVVKVTRVSFDKEYATSIPSKGHIQGFHAHNCGETPLPVSRSLSVSFETSQSVSWNRTVTTSSSVSANMSFTLLAGAGISFSYSKSVAIADGVQGSESSNCSDSQGVSPSVPGNDEIWVEMRLNEYNLAVPVQATIVVDGTVEPNLNNATRISDVLTEAERSFTVTGVLNAATCSSKGELKKYERKLTPEECPVPGGVEVTPYEGSAALLPVVASNVVAQATQPDTTLGPVPVLMQQSLSNQIFEMDDEIELNHGGSSNNADQKTPSWFASGQHMCQSKTSIGHTCSVSGVGYNDCNEASLKLKMDDCCPRTTVCGPDPQTGNVKCELGGNSIGFNMLSCLPQ